MSREHPIQRDLKNPRVQSTGNLNPEHDVVGTFTTPDSCKGQESLLSQRQGRWGIPPESGGLNGARILLLTVAIVRAEDRDQSFTLGLQALSEIFPDKAFRGATPEPSILQPEPDTLTGEIGDEFCRRLQGALRNRSIRVDGSHESLPRGHAGKL